MEANGGHDATSAEPLVFRGLGADPRVESLPLRALAGSLTNRSSSGPRATLLSLSRGLASRSAQPVNGVRFLRAWCSSST